MAKSVRPKTILFFLAGSQPSDEEQEAIAELRSSGDKVMLRNAAFVDPLANLEAFDAVAGEVPKVYARAAEAKERAGEPETEAEREAKAREAAEKAEKKAAEAKAAKAAAAQAKKDGKAPPAAPPAAPAWKPNA